MNSQTGFRLSHHAVITAMVAAAFPLTTFAAAGRVEFSIGSVNAIGPDGRERPLAKGGEINKGDTLQTVNGRMQVRFTDGGYISLQPNTEFKVEDYSFNGKADGSERGFFSLVKGGLRAITGSIGHTNRQTYRVNTPVATIGIRGTEFLAQYDTKLLVKVGDGAVYLANSAGDITLYKGQVGEVGTGGGKPKQSNDSTSVNAAGPAGASPDKTKQDQENQNQATYVDGNVRLENEVEAGLCQTSTSCLSDQLSSAPLVNLLAGKTGADLPTLNSMGVFGVYSASQILSISTGAGPASTGNGTLVMGLDFSDYSASLSISGNFTNGPASGATLSGGMSGLSLNSSTFLIGPSGSTGTTVINGGAVFVSPTTGTLTLNSGSLNSSDLTQAFINYSLNVGSGYFQAPTSATLSGFGYASPP